MKFVITLGRATKKMSWIKTVIVALAFNVGLDAGPDLYAQDAGKIYYARRSSQSELNSVRSEGGGLDPLSNAFDIHAQISPKAQPSRLEHGGGFWYLQREDVGGGWYELFAVREDGSGKIQLTDSNDDLYVAESDFGNSGIRWSLDDQLIGFLGKRIDNNGNVVEAGVFVSVVQFDSSGNLTGLATTPEIAINTGVYPDLPEVDDLDEAVDISSFDLTSDGSLAVWTPYEGGLRVTNLLTGSEQILTSDGVTPSISPNDWTVAFNASNSGGGYLDLINLDGTDRSNIVYLRSRRRKQFFTELPFWSPAGNQLIYTRKRVRRGKTIRDVYRINANGSGSTNMTGSFSGEMTSVAWRLPAVDAKIIKDWAGDTFGGNAWTDRGIDVAVQADGKILLAGLISKNNLQSSQDIMLARFNSNLTIDYSFGNNGVATADFGANSRDYGTRIHLLDDGDILVIGEGFDYVHYPNLIGRGIAARFKSDGTLDAQFEGPEFSGWGGFRSAAELADGSLILLSSEKPGGGDWDVVLTKLNPNFSLDTNFGDNGRFVHDFNIGENNVGNRIVLSPAGQLLVVGSSHGRGYYAGFNVDGTPTNLEGVINLSTTGKSQFKDIAVNSAGELFIAGWSDTETPGDRETFVMKTDFELNVETGFGNQGIAWFNPTSGEDQTELAVDLQGNLFVGGHYLAKIKPDGEIDEAFAENGVAFIGESGESQGISVDLQGRPLVSGEIVGYTGTLDAFLYRLNK